MLEHLGGDEGVAVAIAPHPAADGHHGRQGRVGDLPRKRRHRILDLAVDPRYRVDEGIVEVGERVLDLVLHAQLHGAQHARLPEGGHQPADLGLDGRALLLEEVRVVEPSQPLGDRELDVERALALHLGGVGGEDGGHAHPRKRGHALRPRRAARHRVGEEAAQGGGQGLGPVAPVLAVAADVVAVLGDVGEQREVAERAHHHDRLVVGQGVQRLRERAPGGHVLQAAARHGELADGLDELVGRLTLVQLEGVAQDPAQEPDVRDQRGVLVDGAHGRSFPDLRGKIHRRRGPAGWRRLRP